MKSLLMLVIINSIIWASCSVVFGYLCSKLSKKLLLKPVVIPVTNETYIKLEKFFKIKKWKSIVPEAGGFFKGGTSKKTLSSLDREGLRNFLIETKRAELVHYLIFIVFVLFFFIDPLFLAIIMFIYAVIANIPCILIQRYNRSRIIKILNDN